MLQKKKIFILLGHPNLDSLTGGIADAYEMGALKAGHEVRRQNISEMQFDPILHKGYREIQQLEPDLKTFQENVRWADHVVFLYPNWWGTMPAILKGLVDRVWLPGFAFHYTKIMGFIPNWTKLLKGKTGRIILLANVHPWVQWFLFGDFTNELSRATLKFSGISPVRIKIFFPSEYASKETIEAWMATTAELGKNAR